MEQVVKWFCCHHSLFLQNYFIDNIRAMDRHKLVAFSDGSSVAFATVLYGVYHDKVGDMQGWAKLRSGL